MWPRLKAVVQENLLLQRGGEKIDIEVVVRRSWNFVITDSFLHALYSSMPRRILACIAAKGGHTRY